MQLNNKAWRRQQLRHDKLSGPEIALCSQNSHQTGFSVLMPSIWLILKACLLRWQNKRHVVTWQYVFDDLQKNKQKNKKNRGVTQSLFYGSRYIYNLHPCIIFFSNPSFKSEGIQACSPPALLALFYYSWMSWAENCMQLLTAACQRMAWAWLCPTGLKKKKISVADLSRLQTTYMLSVWVLVCFIWNWGTLICHIYICKTGWWSFIKVPTNPLFVCFFKSDE